MNDDQRVLYEAIAGGPRAAETAFPLTDEEGTLVGPFDAMLLNPRLGHALQAVGASIRFSGRLTDRAREIAILLVGHHHNSDFEVQAHVAVGRRIGLSSDDLADLSEFRAPRTSDEYERKVAEFAMQLLWQGDLDDAAYASAVSILGEELMFEINVVVGYYSLLARQLKIFGGGPSEPRRA